MKQDHGAPHSRRSRRPPRPRTAPPRPVGAGAFSARVLLVALLMVTALALATGSPAAAEAPAVNHPPSFNDGDSTTRSVLTTAAVDANVGAPVTATDPDGDKLTYTISNNASFKIDGGSGQIKVKQALTAQTATVTVDANDDGSLSDSITVTIKVLAPTATPTPTPAPLVAVNHPPSFNDGESTTRSVLTTAAVDANVGAAVTATDPDGDTLTYTISNNASFKIDGSSGQITVKQALTAQTATVTVNANDGSLSDSITVTIKVLAPTATPTPADTPTFTPTPTATRRPPLYRPNPPKPPTPTNTPTPTATPTATNTPVPTNTPTPTPNAGPVFPQGPLTREVVVNALKGTNVGAPVTATAPGTSGELLTYTLLYLTKPVTSRFTINAGTGQITVTQDPKLDLAIGSYKDFEVRATANGKSATVDLTIKVVAANSPPVFTDGETTTRTVYANAKEGDRVIGGPVAATDADGDTLTYSTWVGSDDRFNNVGDSNQLYYDGSPALGDVGTTYTLKLLVQDKKNDGSLKGGSDLITVTFTVVAAPTPTPTPTATNTPAPTATNTPAPTATNTPAPTATNTPAPAPTATATPIPNRAPTGTTATRSIAENAAAGTKVGAPVTTTDPDGDTLRYTLTSNEFALKTGPLLSGDVGQIVVKAGATLDYETTTSYTVTVKASDGSLTTDIPVTINVTDVNEAPVASNATRSIAENSDAGTTVGAPVTTTDPDGDALIYSLSSNEFEFDTSTTVGQASGQIVVKAGANLDYETTKTYSVTVKASDGKLTTDIPVTINVTDVNEVPNSTTATRSIAENAAAGTKVGAPVTTTDPDGDGLIYSLSSNEFKLDTGTTVGQASTGTIVGQTSGQILVKAGANLDYETKKTYTVTLVASDPDNLSADITVTINVTDVNEAPPPAPTSPPANPPPTATPIPPTPTPIPPTPTPIPPPTATPVPGNRPPVGQAATRTVAENAPAGTTVGAPVTATDPDGDALAYSLGSAQFAIHPTSGQITVATGAVLDYETTLSYTVTVTASDGRGGATQYTVTINLTDVPETTPTPPAATPVPTTPTPTPTPVPNGAPSFGSATATRSVAENSAAGTTVGDPVTATDPDGDTLSYQIVPANSTFTIESSSGQLAVAAGAELDYETTPSYTVIVAAHDPSGNIATITVTINVTDVTEAAAVPVSGGPVVRQPATNSNPAPAAPPPVRESNGAAWLQLLLFPPVVARRRRAPVPVGVAVSPVPTAPQSALAVRWRVIADRVAGPVRCAVQYRPAGTRRWQTQHSEGTSTALTLEGLQAGTRYEVRVRAQAGDETSRWVSAGVYRTRAAPQPITTTPTPVVVGWESPASPQMQPVPITVTPPPAVIGWTAA